MDAAAALDGAALDGAAQAVCAEARSPRLDSIEEQLLNAKSPPMTSREPIADGA
jgi:hypothetical protein